MSVLPKKQMALFGFLILLVLGIQMPAIHRPFAGHYASYQGTVMAAIARNMVRENFSEILLPKTDAIIGGNRSLHLNQYPFPALAVALGVRWVGGDYEFWGRFQAICFNFLSLILLILIARKLFDPLTGWIAGCLYALSPYTLVYGQSFMSEACALFFLLLALFVILEHSSFLGVAVSALFFSVAVTGRLHWILLFPVFVWVFAKEPFVNRLKKSLLFLILMLILPVAWYGYTYVISLSATNLHTNLFLQAAAQKTDNLALLKTPQYLVLVFDIVAEMMLTPFIFPFFFVGLILADKKSHSFRLVFTGIFMTFVLVVLTPFKVMKHDFYLYATYPFFTLLAAFAVAQIVRTVPVLGRPVYAVALLLFYGITSVRYFFNPIFTYSVQEARTVEKAKILRDRTEPDTPIIAAGENAPILAYYADRPSWQFQPSLIGKDLEGYQLAAGFSRNDLEDLRQLQLAKQDGIQWIEYLKNHGAAYFFASNKQEIDQVPRLSDYLKSQYQSLTEDQDDYYFYKLSPTSA